MVVAIVGVIVGWTAFALTTGFVPYQTSTGGLCRSFSQQDGGFDPWTGAPYGPSLTCDGVVQHEAVSPAFARRRAISIPEGFVFGAAGAAFALFLLDRRRRSSPLDQAPLL